MTAKSLDTQSLTLNFHGHSTVSPKHFGQKFELSVWAEINVAEPDRVASRRVASGGRKRADTLPRQANNYCFYPAAAGRN